MKRVRVEGGQVDYDFGGEYRLTFTIRPIPDAKSGLRSRDQLKAVTEGRFAMADSVGGTLGVTGNTTLSGSANTRTSSPRSPSVRRSSGFVVCRACSAVWR